MIEIPTEFSETTQEIMSEVDTFTFAEKCAVFDLVRIMADYPGSPEEGLSRIADEAQSILARFEEKERDLFDCMRDCWLALSIQAEKALKAR